MSSRSNTTLVSHVDCPGGGQVWVDGTTLFIGHMRWPSGTTIVDVADPRHPRTLATIDLPEGWHSHKVRASNGIMIVNHEKLGQTGRGRIRRRNCDLRRLAAERAEADHQVAHGRPRRAPLRFRRPLCLPVADRRGLCRQHHDDPRSCRSGPAGRSGTMVDPGAMEGRGENPIRGTIGSHRVAIIRCAWAIGSMSATGTTACSFSIFPTCRGRRRWRTPTPARRFRIRRIPACPFRNRSRDAASWWWRTRMWRSCGHRRPRSPGFTTSRSSNCRCRSRPFRSPGSMSTAARSRR